MSYPNQAKFEYHLTDSVGSRWVVYHNSPAEAIAAKMSYFYDSRWIVKCVQAGVNNNPIYTALQHK